jgi:hypothetical protein
MDIGSFKDRTKSSTAKLFGTFGDNVILLELVHSLLLTANVGAHHVRMPVVRLLGLGITLIGPLKASHNNKFYNNILEKNL